MPGDGCPVIRQRRFVVFDGVGAPSAALQKSNTCLVPAAVALRVAFVASRFTAAVAWPRAAPAALFAPLSYRLMNGFFVVQGFFIVAFRRAEARKDAA